MAQTDFGRVLSRTEVQFKRASDALTQTRLFSEQSNLNAAYEAAFSISPIIALMESSWPLRPMASQ